MYVPDVENNRMGMWMTKSASPLAQDSKIDRDATNQSWETWTSITDLTAPHTIC